MPTPFTDYNKKYGNKVFVNVQGKDVYAERRTYDDIDYWVPVKVNGNYIEIQFEEKEDGSKIYKIYNEQYNESYVQIKIGEKKYYLDGATVKNEQFFALSWDLDKRKPLNLLYRENIGEIKDDSSIKKRAIGDMIANKPSYAE